MQESQHGHVFNFIKLWRILLQNLTVRKSQCLKKMVVLRILISGQKKLFREIMYMRNMTYGETAISDIL